MNTPRGKRRVVENSLQWLESLEELQRMMSSVSDICISVFVDIQDDLRTHTERNFTL